MHAPTGGQSAQQRTPAGGRYLRTRADHRRARARSCAGGAGWATTTLWRERRRGHVHQRRAQRWRGRRVRFHGFGGGLRAAPLEGHLRGRAGCEEGCPRRPREGLRPGTGGFGPFAEECMIALVNRVLKEPARHERLAALGTTWPRRPPTSRISAFVEAKLLQTTRGSSLAPRMFNHPLARAGPRDAGDRQITREPLRSLQTLHSATLGASWNRTTSPTACSAYKTHGTILAPPRPADETKSRPTRACSTDEPHRRETHRCNASCVQMHGR